MKILLLSVITLFSLEANSQGFYRTFKTDDFQSLIKAGITYVQKGDSTDSLYIEAFKKHWTVCPYKIVDPSKDTIHKEDFIFIPGQEIIIVKAKMIRHDVISKTRIIGYTVNNGFGLDPNSKTGIIYNVAFMNSCVNQINKNKISGRSGMVNDRLEKIFLQDRYDKSKTLLVINENIGKISVSDALKLGIKAKAISKEEYLLLNKNELKNYYLLYVDHKDFLTFSIFDIEQKELVFTHRYSNTGVRKIKIGTLRNWTE